MNRDEMQKKLKETQALVKAKIEASPVPAFFIGIVIGIIFADYKQSIVPLLLVCAFVYFGFWLLADHDSQSRES